MDEWRASVYRKVNSKRKMDSKVYRDTRRKILYRDRYHCLRCGQRFPSERLTVHHLIPRSEGGPDTKTNLVTLCNECHDFVEINNLRTKLDIEGSLEEVVIGLEEKSKQRANDWHTWVYGGAKNPNV